MTADQGQGSFERETTEVSAKLAPGPRLAIIGGTSFWHPQSRATCVELGRLLASIDGLVLVTGGVEGVGEAVGRSFHDARMKAGAGADVFHVLPRGSAHWDYGETIPAGADMRERREILGRLADLFIAVEGGPGTAHEASVALARSSVVIPVGRSGGASGELYRSVARPSFAREPSWRALGDADITPEQAAAAVVDIVAAYPGESNRSL